MVSVVRLPSSFPSCRQNWLTITGLIATLSEDRGIPSSPTKYHRFKDQPKRKVNWKYHKTNYSNRSTRTSEDYRKTTLRRTWVVSWTLQKASERKTQWDLKQQRDNDVKYPQKNKPTLNNNSNLSQSSSGTSLSSLVGGLISPPRETAAVSKTAELAATSSGQAVLRAAETSFEDGATSRLSSTRWDRMVVTAGNEALTVCPVTDSSCGGNKRAGWATEIQDLVQTRQSYG